jgi:hypothetical protein
MAILALDNLYVSHKCTQGLEFTFSDNEIPRRNVAKAVDIIFEIMRRRSKASIEPDAPNGYIGSAEANSSHPDFVFHNNLTPAVLRLQAERNLFNI